MDQAIQPGAPAPSGSAGSCTDGQLLERYVKRGDAGAFEFLVRRHGPMVLGVCRRVLRNADDADDAFQATFLVLARKAASVRPPERVGSFLYGVAVRCARDARTAIARRRSKESQVMPRPDAVAGDPAHDLRDMLDLELARLPEKYRLPVVLCDLEGRTRVQVARQLGWAEGTVAGRLARARTLLARRLARRGVAVSALALSLLLERSPWTASLSASLLSSTVKVSSLVAAGQSAAVALVSVKAAALAEGALKALLLTKLKVALVIALVLGIVGGLAYAGRWAALRRLPAEPPAPRMSTGSA